MHCHTHLFLIGGHGDQKFVPMVSTQFMGKISSVSFATLSLYSKIGEAALLAPIPSGLGFPSGVAQSSYYPGNLQISRKEIAAVSSVLEADCVHPENTRIRKCLSGNSSAVKYDVLQASVAVDTQPPRKLQATTLESGEGGGVTIRLIEATTPTNSPVSIHTCKKPENLPQTLHRKNSCPNMCKVS